MSLRRTDSLSHCSRFLLMTMYNSSMCNSFRSRLLFSEYGLDFSVTVDEELAEDALSSICLPTWTPVVATSGRNDELSFELRRGRRPGEFVHALYIDGRLEMGGPQRKSFIMDSAKRIHWWLAKESPDCVFIHAGVVEIDGVAVLLPGRSFVGKSTLVAELLRSGASYLSDEYAVLSKDGLVLPFPRRLSLRGRQTFRPEVFATTPLAPGAVYFVEYQPDFIWDSSPLSVSVAVLRLFENCLRAQANPVGTLESLTRLCKNAPAFNVLRGDSKGAVECLYRDFRQNRGGCDIVPS